MLYDKILIAAENKKKMLGLLIDPGKQSAHQLQNTIKKANESKVDFILTGGSIIGVNIDITIDIIKNNSNIPVFLFPGNLLQLSIKADGIFLLSLISGRNADLLIGNHVSASMMLKRSNMEIIPTGYIIIDGGKMSSVTYMSNTVPIPANKSEIIVATALAGEMLGLKLIYLEAGSGAEYHINKEIIQNLKTELNIPLIVGGGLKQVKTIQTVCKAGADIIIVGNSIENNLDLLPEFTKAVHSF